MSEPAPVQKSIDEINRRIREGEAVVVTAEEMIDVVRSEGVKGAARKVDVVTTGTFGAMCSSGAFLNIGHTKPRIRASKVWLNDVEAYAGIAAVDCYIGATQVPDDDPLNKVHPGRFPYGGGHVIEDLVAGRRVRLRATSYGTDCYPSREHRAEVRLSELRDAVLHNPRNAYQNYNCAVNLSDRAIYTYMGVLRPRMANATYSSAGELSPLLNDPLYRTIGTGTRIFLGGAAGVVTWAGTQHAPAVARNPRGI
ncbi:MAG: homocysteine biosynthesis protein, partial [Deltaproteobacteria bacterium]|nr:homocysteine biosynthesis protein [Deltaproteobacteria bacterium]